MYLEELIPEQSMEDRETEYKARLDRNNTEGWMKTAAGFANASGGCFYIGVEDKTHQLNAFTREEADAERNFFNNQINEHISPRIGYRIEFLPCLLHDQRRYILKIEVEESPYKPVIMKYKGVPAIYMRREGFTNGATYEEIIAMSVSGQRVSYDRLFSGILYRKEDFRKLFRFYAEHNGGKKLTEKTLRALGFMNEKQELANGAVLFRDDYSGKKTTVQCSVFAGFNRGSERIITINRLEGNLTDTLTMAMEFVRQRMNHMMIKKGDTRDNIDAYPERALFEGLVNAIAHRDYYIDGSQIQVDMFRDRLEISSPGSFYQREKLERTYDLTSVISKRRNELICEILVRCNVMEAAGTGFEKIAEEYRKADLSHKPFIFSTSDHFTLVLPDLTFEKGVQGAQNPLVQHEIILDGSRFDDTILSYCLGTARSLPEIAEHLGVEVSTYLRSKVVGNLVEQGFLLKIPASRGYRYRTNPEKAGVE